MNDENLVSEFLLISFYFILRIVQHYNTFSSDIVAKQNSCILLLITDQRT